MTTKKRIYKPGPNIKEKVDSLRSAISDRPPFCSGTLPVVANDLVLFYRKPAERDDAGDAAARCLDLTKATETELKRLVDVCEAATFGVNHEDVLDLAYRNAWKLHPVFFATKLNILHSGLMDSIRYNLLQGNQGREMFFAELYKLNIYGKGSFFKPHKDTPRGDKMFGSLVVVLPTAHEGGTLIFRHDNKEWKFESDIVPPSSISYAAFYGDVEHEVTEVKSGYRLTLTYNLYFGDSPDSQAVISTPSPNSTTLFTTLPPNAASFQDRLAELLSDDNFLPMGGRLGFGLFHEYPFEKEAESGPKRLSERVKENKAKLVRIAEVLKGSDAAIMQACHALDLKCVLNACYKDEDDEYHTVALCDVFPSLEGAYMETEVWEYLKGEKGVALANSDSDVPKREKKQKKKGGTKAEGTQEEEEIDLDTRGGDLPRIDVFVHWVTKQTPNNAFKAHYVAYGNEASLAHDYGRVCLIVNVGPPGRRSEKPLAV